MSSYIDENGTRVLVGSDMDSKDLTEAINSSKSAAELRIQNQLYEHEIEALRKSNRINLIISAIGAAAAIAAAIIGLLG